MKRLKVIRVYKNLKAGGGVQTRLCELLPRLAEVADVRVLCYRSRGERAEEMEEAGIKVDFIPLGIKNSLATYRKYRDYFKGHAPDVVHAHEYTANTFSMKAAAGAEVPSRIRHLHTMVPWGWSGGLRERLRIAGDKRAAKMSSTTLAVSGAVRRLFLDRTGLPESSCEVLYNGVRVDRFDKCRSSRESMRENLNIPVDAKVVGFVGRLAKGKGCYDFVECARSVSERLPETRYLVVGEGGEREQMERSLAELGLAEKAVFTGRMPDVDALMGAMDVFSFTSKPEGGGRIQDGLPGVAIEAQAAGLAVVAYELPMMDEIIPTSETGSLTQVGDAKRLADETVNWLLDDAKRERAYRLARENAVRFSLEQCLENTLAIYERLLRESP